MGAVETLEHTLQDLYEAGKRVEFSWLWDGGVDVRPEKRREISLPWRKCCRGCSTGTG